MMNYVQLDSRENGLLKKGNKAASWLHTHV